MQVHTPMDGHDLLMQQEVARPALAMSIRRKLGRGGPESHCLFSFLASCSIATWRHLTCTAVSQDYAC